MHISIFDSLRHFQTRFLQVSVVIFAIIANLQHFSNFIKNKFENRLCKPYRLLYYFFDSMWITSFYASHPTTHVIINIITCVLFHSFIIRLSYIYHTLILFLSYIYRTLIIFLSYIYCTFTVPYSSYPYKLSQKLFAYTYISEIPTACTLFHSAGNIFL